MTDDFKNDRELQRTHEVTFKSSHTFTDEDDVWIAREQIAFSQTCSESFFQMDHPKNKGMYLSTLYRTILMSLR